MSDDWLSRAIADALLRAEIISLVSKNTELMARIRQLESDVAARPISPDEAAVRQQSAHRQADRILAERDVFRRSPL